MSFSEIACILGIFVAAPFWVIVGYCLATLHIRRVARQETLQVLSEQALDN